MLKRTGFARKTYTPAPPAPLRRLDRAVVYAGASDVVVVCQKGEVAKPGKRAPTVDESRWMNAIVAYGCIACHLDGMAPRPTAVHHILRGGVRMGHRFTLGLCDPGHHQGGQEQGLVSRHPWKARFEAKYGTELELLELTRARLPVPDIRSFDA